MIVNSELVKMVSSNTLFKGISKDFLKSFVKPKNYYGVKEGTIIYSKGEEATNLYLIVEGEVKIKFCDKKKVEHKFITDFFGEEEILNKEIRASHAVANHDSILYSIKVEDLENLVQQQRKISGNLVKKNDNDIYGFTEQNDDEQLIPNELNPNAEDDLNLDDSINDEVKLDSSCDESIDESIDNEDSQKESIN
ncbi:MAG: cyclic nucleotide-binding domain-containing protein [Ignavibacteria bacterium]|nr:cyclic nucleotide-binding domain-containing protein [Ignavibacteria bacterium]